jgi:hypothetical protein
LRNAALGSEATTAATERGLPAMPAALAVRPQRTEQS